MGKTPGAAISAVLLAAHGDGGEARRNQALRLVADDLADRVAVPVDWAVLKEPETFAAAHARLGRAAGGRVVVYPFFMSDGYFVRIRLPQVLARAGFTQTVLLAPLGADPRLLDLVEARIRGFVDDDGDATAEPRVLLVAHGSASGEPASRRGAEAAAAALDARGLGYIHLGYIEEPPLVAEAIAAVDPDIVIGYFASEGTHALDDVATLVAERPRIIHHVAAIGTDPGIPALVAAAVEDCISHESA